MEYPKIYVDESFDDPAKEAEIMGGMPEESAYQKTRNKTRNKMNQADSEFRIYHSEPILSRDQEHHLFRQLHFLKYKLSKLSNHCKDELDTKTKELTQLINRLSNRLILCNARLVMNLVKKRREYIMHPSYQFMMELVSDGNIGLMRAVHYFDWRYGTKFSTYATWVIRHALQAAFDIKAKEENRFITGKDEIFELVAKQEYEYDDKFDKLHQALETIPLREQHVITEYFIKKRHMKEIGVDLKVSKEMIRQLKNKGLERLKKKLVVVEEVCEAE